MIVHEGESLARRTTFKVGGSVRFFIEISDTREIPEALAFAHARSLPWFVLSGGANTLADDGEAEGVCIAPRIGGMAVQGDRERAELVAGASEPWDDVVKRAVAEGLWGLENLSAIPGLLGGAIVQNIGAYGAALSQHLSLVEVFDCVEGRTIEMTPAMCAFGYRASIFKKEPHRYIVVRAAFSLLRQGIPALSYRDLRERFPNANPTLSEVRDGISAIRALKFPDSSIEGTAGSFFANPSVGVAEALLLKERYPELPLFPVPESDEIKVPIAWLLDHALNLRGYRMGPVRLFERQALVLVADRGARAADVRALARDVAERVERAFALKLVPEVVVMRGAHASNSLE